MHPERRVFAVSLLVMVVIAGSASTGVLAQSFGIGDQVLAIGSSAFHPLQSTEASNIATGDLYYYSHGLSITPLNLPNGAEVVQLCVNANVPENGASVTLQLYTQILSGGSAPVADSLVQETSIGYGTQCTAPFSYTIREFADPNGGGNPEPLAHVLVATLIGTAPGLGGARVFWRRQVSPAPAVPSFNDVPATDPAFQFVEALVASGVTAGCGGENFCPDAPLNRRQMAVFLSKALGLHWPN
jgi:hypothetical protein